MCHLSQVALALAALRLACRKYTPTTLIPAGCSTSPPGHDCCLKRLRLCGFVVAPCLKKEPAPVSSLPTASFSPLLARRLQACSFPSPLRRPRRAILVAAASQANAAPLRRPCLFFVQPRGVVVAAASRKAPTNILAVPVLVDDAAAAAA
eukprot:CAMPEP_0171973976 /NCGR_PEP_ID=MMETSP0993-20121228/230227_1 /TAXON_ID=483369 /ORGANISM="non described non described, Strain CCMP2098" /LENGTH=149 /DNA_ID=CAMNT_0012624889 /DNA_START=68 /DNA_END=514 /DNA_ORIENTATION=-